MTHIKIHCGACGFTWAVYGRDNWNSETAGQCPNCFAKIDRQVWEKQIIPAFAAAQDANAELYKDSTGYKRPLFTVDFVSMHKRAYTQNKRKID